MKMLSRNVYDTLEIIFMNENVGYVIFILTAFQISETSLRLNTYHFIKRKCTLNEYINNVFSPAIIIRLDGTLITLLICLKGKHVPSICSLIFHSFTFHFFFLTVWRFKISHRNVTILSRNFYSIICVTRKCR